MENQVPPDTHNLSEGGLTAIVISFVFSSLSTFFLGLRFYVRHFKRVGLFLEDWLIFAALVCLTLRASRNSATDCTLFSDPSMELRSSSLPVLAVRNMHGLAR